MMVERRAKSKKKPSKKSEPVRRLTATTKTIKMILETKKLRKISKDQLLAN